jgi:hypothetical protein
MFLACITDAPEHVSIKFVGRFLEALSKSLGAAVIAANHPRDMFPGASLIESPVKNLA